jgi:competence protein ComEC
MRRPLLYPLIALIAGIIIGDYLVLPQSLLLAGTLLILLLLLVCVRRNWSMAAFLFILSLILTVGLFGIQREQYLAQDNQHIVHQADQGKLTVEGTVMSSDQMYLDRQSLIVCSQRIVKNNSYIPVKGNIRLVIPSDLSFQYGDFIRFHSSIKKIQSFHNPGSFDYERYLNRQGIFVSGFVANNAGIVLIRHNTADRFKYHIEYFRLYLQRLIYANAPTPQREILEAMTIGNQKAIPPAVQDDFAKTGTSHFLSISGLHIGMVAAGGFFLIFFLLKSSEYLLLKFNIIKLATAAAFVPVMIYSLLAGMGTTVLRSTLMSLAFLAALMLRKKRDLYNSLFGAALIILIISPESLFDISFQLSFSAVFALLYIVPKFSNINLVVPSSLPHWLQMLIRQIYLFILVSAAATLGTLPIIVFYFNRISAVTLIANLIAVPLLGMLTLTLAMAFILTAMFSPGLSSFFIKAASFFTGISVDIINRLAALSWSTFSFSKPNMAEIILFYIFIFLLIETITPGSKNNNKGFPARHPSFVRTALLISLALILADAVYFVLKDQYSTDLKITAIDVGQGSSTLVQLPHGINMLIDGGGFPDSSFDMGKSVIAPFLYSQRIGKIDIVVLTHPHPDHLQGLIYIVNNFDVKEVWCTGVKADDDLYLLWEKTILEKKIKIKRLSSQSPPENISGTTIQCLWPFQAPIQNDHDMSFDDTNDSSLVLKISYGKKSFMVTGDISAYVETLLIASGQNLKSDLLFMPHHGSKYSNSIAFIRAVSCRYAIASAGKNNVFHHPHPAVLDRYHVNGVVLFRTDQQGAITIQTNGKALEITPWLK